MNDVHTTRLRRMTEDDLEMIRRWRNHPNVRRHMYTSHEIDRDEHVQWFERSTLDPNRFLLIHERAGQATAYVSFRRSTEARRAQWGFYIAPEAPKGSGREMAQDALDYAFHVLSLHKVCGEALASNVASIGFHEALGFVREGVLRDQHFDGRRYHDVVCYGLLNDEWRNRRQA